MTVRKIARLASSVATLLLGINTAAGRNQLLLNGMTFGGSGIDTPTAVSTDPNGFVYVAGWTDSSNFPGTALTRRNGVDAFVAKWAPGGMTLIYCVVFGGTGDDRATGVAVDKDGNAFVTGTTSSTDFPVVNAFQNRLHGAKNAFVAKLNAIGGFVYSTYIGGSMSDESNAIAISSAGEAYIAGSTTSSNFPSASSPLAAFHGGSDAFVARLSASGNALLYSAYIGGSRDDTARAICVDPSGNLWITGSTSSSDFATSSPFQPAIAGSADAFVTKIDVSTGRVALSTYLGGTSGGGGLSESGTAIASDNIGNIFVVGTTPSLDFPTRNATRVSPAVGVQHAFITRFTASGAVIFSMCFGGSNLDAATSVAADQLGNVYVAGYTASGDFPSLYSGQRIVSGMYDAFVMRVKADGTLVASTLFGGSQNDTAAGIALLRSGTVAVVGQSASSDLPTSIVRSTSGGSMDAFVATVGGQDADIDQNGKPDLILQNQTTNAISFWYMGGTAGSILLNAPVIGASVPGWAVVAAADFDGDGHVDLLLQNRALGLLSIWYMGGTFGAAVISAPVVQVLPPGFHVAAAADFDNDGTPDLLLSNDTTGVMSIWFMGGPLGTDIQSTVSLNSAGGGWRVAGAADFNGDGVTDVVAQNVQTGEIQIWFASGSRSTYIVNAIVSLGNAAPGWNLVGAADFDGNGCPDLILANDTIDAVSIWYMAGSVGTVRLSAPIISYKVPGWHVVA